MKRRAFVYGAVAMFVAPAVADAQPAGKVYRVGFLAGDSFDSPVAREARGHLPDLLRRHSYVESQNLFIEWRWGEPQQLLEVAKDLIRTSPNVIVARGPALVAAAQATKTIPIVMLGGNLPVESGLIHSLARPGGNVTGTTYNPPEVAAKLLEVVKDSFPNTRRVTVVYDSSAAGMLVYKAATDHAAPLLGVALQYVELRRPEDLASAIDEIDKGRPDVLYIVPTDAVRFHLSRLIRFALDRKLPTHWGPRDSSLTQGVCSTTGPTFGTSGNGL